MSDSIQLSSVTLDSPDAGRLAAFYADITGGTVTNLGEQWATVQGPGGRMDFQTVPGYTPPTWPDPTSSIMMHLDFHVEDRAAAEARVLAAGAIKPRTAQVPLACSRIARLDGRRGVPIAGSVGQSGDQRARCARL